jgi:hypothetical protein
MVGLAVLVCVATGMGVAAKGRMSTDAQVVMIVTSAIAYGAIFTFGHLLLRRHEFHHRGAYAGLGAVAAFPPFLLAAGLQALAGAAAAGALSSALFVPVLIGGVAGFLYHRRAGYETDEDEGDDLAVTDVFDGPIVVRNSPGAVLVAALAASAFLMIAISLFIIQTGGFLGPVPKQVQGPGMGVPQAILGGALMAAPLIILAHRILRGLRRHSYRSYLTSALVGPGLITLLALVTMGPIGILMFPQWAIPSIIGMMTYRKLAGLEPAPLPEVVEVTDRRTLVPADHASRQAGAIMHTGRTERVFGRAQRS